MSICKTFGIRLRRFLVFSSISLLASAFVAAQAAPIVWVAQSLQRVGPSDPAQSGTQAQLWAGKGEYESFQIIVHAPSTGLTNVNVSVSGLTGPGGQVIGGSNIALFREQYVYVNASSPNWGGANQPIWVDVFVPRSAAAGQYSGTFTVTSDQGSASGQVLLNVWNFTLPLQPTLQSSFAFMGGYSLAGAQELLRNKVSPLDVNAGDEAGLMSR